MRSGVLVNFSMSETRKLEVLVAKMAVFKQISSRLKRALVLKEGLQIWPQSPNQHFYNL